MTRPRLRLLVGPVMVLAAAAIVANAVVFFAWTAPRWSERWGAIGAAGRGESARQRVEPTLQRMRDTYGRLHRAEEDLDAFRQQLTTTIGGSDLLGMLVDAGEIVGIELDDADFQLAPIAELGVVRMAITLPVSGSYEAVRGLLDQLLELPVFLVVDGIGLQTMSATASPLGRTPAAGAPIRVDLSLSVFVDDQELASGLRRPPATPVSASANRAADTLRQAARSEDPDDIADVLMTQLAALPPLPIDADQLIIDIDQLDEPVEAVAPSRNLFSVVTAPVTAPPPIAFAGAVEMPVPEASFPVRLVGVLKIDGRWHASLTDDVEVFVAAAGDRLSNGVQVIEVGADYVDVEFGDRRTRLTLEGSRP